MKLKHYVILLCCGGLFSCKKIIDLNSESNLTTGSYYSNLAEVKAGLAGAYNGMQAALYNEWQFTELRSDNSKMGVTGSTATANREFSDLDMFIPNPSQQQIFNYWRAFTQWPGQLGEGSLDTWTPTNTGAKLPIYSNKDMDDDRPSSFFVESGSYLRLKSIQVGYTLPAIKGISKLRIYAQGYNLFTITKYTGLDPEVSTGAPGSTGIDFGGNFPISTKVLLGVNLTL